MAFRTLYSILFSILLPALALARPIDRDLQARVADAARRAFLDPKLILAIIKVESNFQKTAKSPKGAMGLMQVMKSTAVECEIHDPYHVTNHLMGATECLRKLVNRYGGDFKLALAAYNAGPANVDKYGGIPPFRETQRYVRLVMAEYNRLKAN